MITKMTRKIIKTLPRKMMEIRRVIQSQTRRIIRAKKTILLMIITVPYQVILP